MAKRGGFTLLEMLVATALFAVLAGSLYASLHIAFKARDSATAALDPARRLELALNLLEQDLRSAMIPKGILAGSFTGLDGKDASGNESDCLVLCCTTSEAAYQGAADVKKVELSCEQSAQAGEQVLLRRITNNLLSPRTLEPRVEVICRSVRAFNLRFFDGLDWQDIWDAGAYDNTLPPAVEVTIEINTNRPTRQAGIYRMSRIILIPCGTAASTTTVALARGDRRTG